MIGQLRLHNTQRLMKTQDKMRSIYFMVKKKSDADMDALLRTYSFRNALEHTIEVTSVRVDTYSWHQVINAVFFPITWLADLRRQ